MAAVSSWPYDPQFRRALIEWPLLVQSDANDAIEGLSMFLEHDLSSPDAIRLRMLYESRLGLTASAQRDARALQKFTKFVEP
jgi:hypothetical protein